MQTMKAVVFTSTGCLALQEVPRPSPGPGEAVIRVTATTICGTDVHIVRGEYPVEPGLILGHEPSVSSRSWAPGWNRNIASVNAWSSARSRRAGNASIA